MLDGRWLLEGMWVGEGGELYWDESSEGGRDESRRGSSERGQVGVRERGDEWRVSCREWEKVHTMVCGYEGSRADEEYGYIGDPNGCDECKRERG